MIRLIILMMIFLLVVVGWAQICLSLFGPFAGMFVWAGSLAFVFDFFRVNPWIK